MNTTMTLPACSREWLYVPDVTYHTPPEGARQLQLIVPYDVAGISPDTRFPLIAFVPGSAWYRQEMYNSLPAWSRLAEMGFVFAAVQVRESTLARFPAQVEDAERALLFLRAHAEAWHIDPARMFLAGNSSGGHIALLTALRSACGLADAPGFSGDMLRGVIALSAPSDLLLDEGRDKAASPPGFRPVEALLGVDDRWAHPDAARAASCPTYLQRLAPGTPLPAFLLMHGDRDPQVSVENSRRLYPQLLRAGARATYVELTGAGHGGGSLWSPPMLAQIAGFIREV